MALILKDNPIVEPAAVEKIYNVWWVENLTLDATLTASTEPILVVDYRLCYMDENGKPCFHPTETRRLHMRDLFSYTATDENVYNAVWNAVDVLGSIGKTQGVLD